MERLVTVATFYLPAEAEAGKLLLEQEGIRAFLADANLVRTNWFLANAVGGAKLQVAASDAEKAREILEDHESPQTDAPADLGKGEITFACEECGASMALSRQRCGHVETCPSCGAYVDVPDATESPPPVDGQSTSQSLTIESEPPKGRVSDSRAPLAIWIEVLAVLCLAYFPYLFRALASFSQRPDALSFGYRALYIIVDSIQVSMPVLVILALAKDPWSLFGIVRPKWITDVLVGCMICVAGMAAYRYTLSFLPFSMLDTAAALQRAHHPQPEGIPAYVLLFVGCVAGPFAEELVMRGYLIARLERLLGSTWLPVLVTSLLFASYHVYRGVAPAIATVATGLVFAISFCLLRRLWPLCVAHALANLMAHL